MNAEDVATFRRCIAVGGVALFPADTVYGLATDPQSSEGVDRLYRLKGRAAGAPAAVMFFRPRAGAGGAARARRAHPAARSSGCCPGRSRVVLPNRARRFPLACGPEPERLGLRVPRARGRARPAGARRAGRAPVERQPERRAGRRAAWTTWTRRIRAGVDMVLDAGELPGTASTVVVAGATTRTTGDFEVLREGPWRREIAARCATCSHRGAATVTSMTELSPDFFTKPVAEVDPEIAEVLVNEAARQESTLEMIASENFVPQAILDCQGSVLTNKYAEGYPGRRYYGGCEYVDVAERAGDRAREGAVRRRARERAAARRARRPTPPSTTRCSSRATASSA